MTPVSSGPVTVRMKFKSGPLAVRAALAHILSELKPAGVCDEDLGTIEIVLAEAMNNIVEHAYPEDDVPGPIDIECQLEGETVFARIVDNGSAMPGEEIPEIEEANLDTDMLDLPEGGFGWFLIRELVQTMEYRRDDQQNILDLTMTARRGQ